MAVLLTGGAGYIGSHTALALLRAGYDVVVLDNLCNSSRESLARVEWLGGRSVTFIEGDIRDRDTVVKVLREHRISEVVHFAGLKAVGQSSVQPLAYYENNVAGTITLCQAMAAAGVKTLVFSSSATVYDDGQPMPLTETASTGRPTNPYGQSKLVIEGLLRDLQASDPEWSIALLRYFNPVGAHESGQIGEDPNGTPNNLLPYVMQVAIGRLPELSVYGGDYPTRDGTGVRDFIHVMDLAEGHLRAVEFIRENIDIHTWNLGTGTGYSVLEVIDAFERVSGQPVPYIMVDRRAGDIAECWADPAKADRELGWRSQRGLDAIMRDGWQWQRNNPAGYRQ